MSFPFCGSEEVTKEKAPWCGREASQGLCWRGRERPNSEEGLETSLKFSVLLLPWNCVGSGGVSDGGSAFPARAPHCSDHGGGKPGWSWPLVDFPLVGV